MKLALDDSLGLILRENRHPPVVLPTLGRAIERPDAKRGRRWRAPASFVYGVGDQAATAA
jgi:hypothetical protein